MDISIIITAYNAEKFISATLDSIARQTYLNFEVIIVDDASTDQTLAIINQFISQKHPQQYKLFSGKRLGRALALQFAISKAAFDWIAILDADDLWHHQKLEAQVNYIKHFQLAFLATKSILFKKDVDIHALKPIDTLPNISQIKKINFSTMLCRNEISHISVLFKKSLANYDSSRKSQLDYELWLRLLQQNIPLFMLDFNLAFHRIHDKQFFEGQKRLWYIVNTTRLQLWYCISNFKIWPIFYIAAKIIFYPFISRRVKVMHD